MPVESGSYTPESLARRRKLAEALFAQSSPRGPIGGHLQGLSQLANTFVAAKMMKDVDAKEEELEKRASDHARKIGRALMGGENPENAEAALFNAHNPGELEMVETTPQRIPDRGEALNLAMQPEGARALQGNPVLARAIAAQIDPRQRGQTPSNIQEWEHYNRLSPADQERYLEMKRSQQTFLPEIGGVRTLVRPGVAGAPIQTQPLSTLDVETRAAEALAGAKQQGQADVKLQTEPQLARETTLAEQGAKADVQREQARLDSQRAFDTYMAARNNLSQAMLGTQTGPISGRIPAVTSPQQIAEGAAAAMAPVLKQLFRASGEGVFTDRDQQLLMDMVPKRTDHPEVVTAKLEMIDQVVAAKLGTSASRPNATPQRGAQEAPSREITATGPNDQKLVLRNGQWVPLQ